MTLSTKTRKPARAGSRCWSSGCLGRYEHRYYVRNERDLICNICGHLLFEEVDGFEEVNFVVKYIDSFEKVQKINCGKSYEFAKKTQSKFLYNKLCAWIEEELTHVDPISQK